MTTMENKRDMNVGNELSLIDQTLDHELDALLKVLGHNMRVIGYPIDACSERTLLEQWNSPLENMSHLYDNMICVTDPLGYTYLMPCLAQNPTQTKKKREGHKHFFINVQ